jgi:hypothetical protein
MPEADFAAAFDLEDFPVFQSPPDNHYYFRDNGSSVLAVAHLDTVGRPHTRQCNFIDTESGTVVYSRGLDDRLGAYIILDLLPKLGITYDLLLTVGEECGQSTARFFDPPKEYDWIIEFDRGGTDVVMYQYDDEATRDLVRASGARVDEGIFTDICYLEHLNVKAFNWGVGYQDYHSARSHAYLDDTFAMVGRYLLFHAANAGTRLPHDPDSVDMGYEDMSYEDMRYEENRATGIADIRAWIDGLHGLKNDGPLRLLDDDDDGPLRLLDVAP